eukprot:9781165-Ditylum_brightwellii.AAC.1
MERGMHDVGEVNSEIDSRSGTPHIRETDYFYNANTSIMDKDENTLVIPEVPPPVVEHLSPENGTSNGTQPKNITDVSMLLLHDVPTPHTANTQEEVYSD